MRIDLKFNENAQKLDLKFGETGFIHDATEYEGSYEVTPRVEGQRLETAKKIMKEDLLVNSIPYFEVTNSANGKTVTIA